LGEINPKLSNPKYVVENLLQIETKVHLERNGFSFYLNENITLGREEESYKE